VTLLGEAVSLKTGSMYMVIGEVQELTNGPCLQARVVRNVDGMDVDLFSAALKLHRTFEQQKKVVGLPRLPSLRRCDLPHRTTQGGKELSLERCVLAGILH
jgi:hypothetical protein